MVEPILFFRSVAKRYKYGQIPNHSPLNGYLAFLWSINKMLFYLFMHKTASRMMQRIFCDTVPLIYL